MPKKLKQLGPAGFIILGIAVLWYFLRNRIALDETNSPSIQSSSGIPTFDPRLAPYIINIPRLGPSPIINIISPALPARSDFQLPAYLGYNRGRHSNLQKPGPSIYGIDIPCEPPEKWLRYEDYQACKAKETARQPIDKCKTCKPVETFVGGRGDGRVAGTKKQLENRVAQDTPGAYERQLQDIQASTGGLDEAVFITLLMVEYNLQKDNGLIAPAGPQANSWRL
jgi:hypothetical protein